MLGMICFFSSRRRHTRYWRDWSSDVCSSDLRTAEGRKPVASSQQPARSRRPEPVLITEAAPSLAEQHAARKKRYVITMAVRGVSLVLAAVFYQTLWLAIIFAALGTVSPWIAVMMANDRPPKKKLDVNRYNPPRPDRILRSEERRVGKACR